ncbi:unnamed protein product, partial [Prorocentrum cordatum]
PGPLPREPCPADASCGGELRQLGAAAAPNGPRRRGQDWPLRRQRGDRPGSALADWTHCAARRRRARRCGWNIALNGCHLALPGGLQGAGALGAEAAPLQSPARRGLGRPPVGAAGPRRRRGKDGGPAGRDGEGHFGRLRVRGAGRGQLRGPARSRLRDAGAMPPVSRRSAAAPRPRARV